MTLRDATLVLKRATRRPANIVRRIPRSAPVVWWQLLVILLVAAALGWLFILLPEFKPPEQLQERTALSARSWSLLAIMMSMSPFLFLIAVAVWGDMRRLLLAVMFFEMPFQLDYRFGYSELEQHFGTISGLSISLTTICLVILYLWWLVEILSRRVAPPPKAFYQLILPALLYFGLIVASVLWSESPSAALNWSGLFAQAFLIYVYLANNIKTRSDLDYVLKAILLVLIFNGLIIAFYGVTGRGELAVNVSAEAAATGGQNVNRVGGPLKVPNLTGSYLAISLTVVYSLFAAPAGRFNRLLIAGAVALAGFNLLWTGSRGAWLSFAVGGVILTVLMVQRGYLKARIPLAYGLIAGMLLGVFIEPILARLFSEGAQDAAAARLPLNILAMRMVADHPFVGVGINNFAANLRDYVTSEFTGEWIRTVHNQYLLVWSETGTIGLLLFVWFLWRNLRFSWQVWRSDDHYLGVAALGLGAALLAAMVHMTGEKYHSRIQTELVWTMAGILTAVYRLWNRETIEST